MWLVLCPEKDTAALWAYRGLLARGLAPLELVSAEVLANAITWEHRVSDQGTLVQITLTDGRVISSERTLGVLNRLVVVPNAQSARAQEADRDYAHQELHALYMSWLMAMPGVVLNRPCGQGLSGAWRHTSEWAALAAQSGLPTARYRQSGSTPLDLRATATMAQPHQAVVSAVVVGDQICGPELPAALAEGCRRLADLAGLGIMGVDFAVSPRGSLYFAAASPVPDLRIGGQLLLDALAGQLIRGMVTA